MQVFGSQRNYWVPMLEPVENLGAHMLVTIESMVGGQCVGGQRNWLCFYMGEISQGVQSMEMMSYF